MADPGFPVGGHQAVVGVPTSDLVLFGENVCKNERIGGGRIGGTPLDPPMGALLYASMLVPCRSNRV